MTGAVTSDNLDSLDFYVFRRSRNMNEAMSLGDSINHVYIPSVTD